MSSMMQARADRQEVLLATLVEIRQHLVSSTEAVQLLRSNVVNAVLLTELVQLDATGYAQRSFPTPMGSVVASNHSAATALTVTGTSVGGAAPSSGVGVYRIPKNTAAVVNIASHVLSLFGEANGLVSVQVFAKGQAPAFGPA